LLAGFDALAGRARLLAERLVDGLALFAPRGPRFLACGRGKGADPRAPLPERSGVVVKTTVCSYQATQPISSPVRGKP